MSSRASPELSGSKSAPAIPSWRDAPLLLGLAAIYFGAAKLGLSMAFGAEQVTAVWPPTGIALAAVLLLGYRVWPGIWLGAFLANATANEPAVAACAIAIGNTLEALAGAALLRSVGFRTTLGRLSDVLGLVVLAAVGSTTISATIGTSSLLLAGVQPWASFGAIWWTWWVGDAIGDLVIVPVVLAWAAWLRAPSWQRGGETLALLASLVAATGLVFVGPVQSILSGPPLEFLAFPFVIWGALRFGQRGVATVTFVAAAMAIWGTLHGSGPFATGREEENLITAQLFMGVLAASGLLLAAAVAERSEAEGKVRESESRLKGIIESAMDAVITIDEHERIVLFNAAAETMFGCRSSEAIGTPIDRFIPASRRDVHHRHIRQFGEAAVTSRSMGAQRTLSALRRDGAEFPMEATISQTVVAGQKLYTVIIRNVTERVRAEQERDRLLAREQAARSELEAAHRLKDEFLAMLGHELRNPLGAIRTAIGVLNRAGKSDERTARSCEIVDRQARHLTRLIEDLLDVSRLASGKMVLHWQPVDLGEVADRCVRTLRDAGRVQDKALSLAKQRAPVEGDPARLEQLVFNLLDNALKFTPAGGQIAVTVEPEGGHAVVRVRDTGIGIDAELLERIFEPFVQGDTRPDPPQGGLGLGLALVRRLVELHDGSVSVASGGAGRGSEFVVRLPLFRDAPVRTRGSAAAVASVPRPRHIVIIEDNDDARDALLMLLQGWGHHVQVASEGERGLECLLASRPEIAFVDVGLPGLDGYAIARAVRATPGGAAIHLVALTGFGQPEDRSRALEAGFDAHLVKPADERELLRVLASAEAGQRLRLRA